MSIRFDNLDGDVRDFMVREVDRDISNGSLYISHRLSAAGATAWPQILRDACRASDDMRLAEVIRSRGLLRTEEVKRKPKGGVTTAKIPDTAPDTLAEGEFNRYYVRGLCAQVIDSGGVDVEVYRGKEVRNPRPESEAMIGQRLSARTLLDDLRNSPGVEPALGLPPGPNSGLSVRRI